MTAQLGLVSYFLKRVHLHFKTIIEIPCMPTIVNLESADLLTSITKKIEIKNVVIANKPKNTQNIKKVSKYNCYVY